MLDHALLVGVLLIGMIVLNLFLLRFVSFTLFPEQDNGLLMGQIIADQSISFPAMATKLKQLQGIVQSDPAVASVIGFTGTRALNTANVYVALKPLAQRKLSADQVVQRLRPKLNRISGGRLFLQAVQDLHIGGRQSAAEYQYTLTSEDTAALISWTPKLLAELGQGPHRYHGREFRHAAERPADLHQHRPRRRRAVSGSRPIKSTACSTTRSGSAPSRPSSIPSTSTTW